jgi:ketosteroid isomerase-like protein
MEYVMSDSQKPAELFRRSLDAFLAKDMRAWADLCAEDVLVEFPFAPAGTPSRLDGRVAIFEYLRNYPKIIDVHEIDSLEIYRPTARTPSSASGASRATSSPTATPTTCRTPPS